MKIQKRMPLLMFSVLASMLLVSLTANVSAHGIYQEYNTYGGSQPSVAVLMEGLSHHIYPWNPQNGNSFSGNTQLADNPSGQAPELPPSGGMKNPGTGSEIHTTADEAGSGSNPQENPVSDPNQPDSSPGTGQQDLPGSDPNQPDSSVPGTGQQDLPDSSVPGTGQQDLPDSQSDQPQEPDRYEFTEVSQDYFDDALLIGDSRAVGVQLYSGWDNLTYYAESGMTVYNMFTRPITDRDGTETTIEEALKNHSFGKIYLEIGINEMGTGTVDSFMEAYEAAVLRLQELQPDADIFLCAIMYVRKSKSDSDPIFNNPGIRERNERIAQLADQKTVFYLDINEVTSDESGNLNPDYTWDEVHLLGKYNVLWTEYLSRHGIIKEPVQ